MNGIRKSPCLGRRGRFASAARWQQGLTIIELMVGMTIGLIIVAAIGTIYLNSRQTFRSQEALARLQESGRFALDVIGRSLRQGGYADLPVTPSARKVSFSGTAIGGAEGGTGPDRVTVQYDGVVGSRDCEGNTVTAANRLVQDSFNLDTANRRLRCDGQIAVTPVAAGNGDPLVEGVEDLQVIYGLDTDNDQSANRYVTASSAVWGQVVSARICVLIRSTETSVSTGGQRYLNCAGALGTATGTAAYTTAVDTRLRQPFVATFNLRNRISTYP